MARARGGRLPKSDPRLSDLSELSALGPNHTEVMSIENPEFLCQERRYPRNRHEPPCHRRHQGDSEQADIAAREERTDFAAADAADVVIRRVVDVEVVPQYDPCRA